MRSWPAAYGSGCPAGLPARASDDRDGPRGASGAGPGALGPARVEAGLDGCVDPRLLARWDDVDDTYREHQVREARSHGLSKEGINGS